MKDQELSRIEKNRMSDGRLLCLVDLSVEKGQNLNFRSMSKMMESGVTLEAINRRKSPEEIWPNLATKEKVKFLLNNMTQQEVDSLAHMTSLYHLVLVKGGVSEYIVNTILIPSRIRLEDLEGMTYEDFKSRTGGVERLSVYKKVMSAYLSYIEQNGRLRINVNRKSSLDERFIKSISSSEDRDREALSIKRLDGRLLCLVDVAIEKGHDVSFRSMSRMMESGVLFEEINRKTTRKEIWPNSTIKKSVKALLADMSQEEVASLDDMTSLYHLVLVKGGVSEYIVNTILIPSRIRFTDLEGMTYEDFQRRTGRAERLSIYKKLMSAYDSYIRHQGRLDIDEDVGYSSGKNIKDSSHHTDVWMDERVLCLADLAIEKGRDVSFRQLAKMMESGVTLEIIKRRKVQGEIWPNQTIRKSIQTLLADLNPQEIDSLNGMTSLYHLVLAEEGMSEYIVKNILIPSRIRFTDLDGMAYETFKKLTGGVERSSVYERVMSAYESYVGRKGRMRGSAVRVSLEHNSTSNRVHEIDAENGKIPLVGRVKKASDGPNLKKIVRRLISVYDRVEDVSSFRSWSMVSGLIGRETSEGLRRLEKLKFVSISNLDVKKKFRSLDEFLETLEDGQGKLFLKKRLSGMSTADIAKVQGVSHQRISQVLGKVLEMVPVTHIKEARRTIDIFREYAVDHEFFTEVLLEKKETFYLLKLKCNKERIRDGVKKSKLDCLNQLLPDQRIRFLHAESLFEDENGDVVKMTKRNLMKKYFFMHGRDSDSTKNHHVRYSEFLDEELHGKKSVIEEYGISLHNFESTIAESSYCIHSYDQKVRYFEVDRIVEEKANLEKLFMLPEGIYSTSFVYETNESYFRSLDIKDHHELHNVLKRMLDLDFIKIRRIPEFAIGVEDKIKWFTRLIKKLSPITLDAFIEHLEQNFGLHGPSTRTRVLTDLPEYVTPERKLIHVSTKPATIHKNFLKRILVDDIYIAQDLIDGFPVLKSSGNLYLNKKMLKSVGYVLSGGFIVREEIGSGECYYRNLLMGNQYFVLDESPLLKTRSFRKTISELQSGLDLLQIGRNHYMNISVLEKIGIAKSDLIDFQKIVSRSFSDERYFTVKNIHERVPHKILELGFDDIFYERLCRAHEGIRYIPSATGDIFYRGEHVRNLTDFVRDCIIDGMSVDELLSFVTQEFGISLDPNKTIEKIRMTGAHYVPETRRIHFDKRDFFEQLYAGVEIK